MLLLLLLSAVALHCVNSTSCGLKRQRQRHAVGGTQRINLEHCLWQAAVH